jgi:hypothetical protein
LEQWINDKNSTCPISGEKIIDIKERKPTMAAGQRVYDKDSKEIDGSELKYFDVYGRAQQLRMMMYYCNVDFKDTRVSFEEFGKNKAAGEYTFGSLPIMILPNGN